MNTSTSNSLKDSPPISYTSEKPYWIKNLVEGENTGKRGGRSPYLCHRIFSFSETAQCGTNVFSLHRVLKLAQYRKKTSLIRRSYFRVSEDQG